MFFGSRLRGLFAFFIRQHLHPISAHVPNGVLPLSVLFFLLSAFLGWQGLSQAAMYNMVFVVIVLPFVIFSGYLEWKLKYSGHMTWLFKAKTTSAFCTFGLALVLTLWLVFNPDSLTSPGGGRVVFILLSLAMLAAATTAGYLGGKLVFKD